MKFTTTAFVVVAMGASALAQLANPGETIKNVRNQVRSATNAVDQRRETTVNQAASPAAQSAAKKQGSSTKPSVSQMEVKKGKASAPPEDSPAAAGGNTVQMRGKRDPFVSVIRTQSIGGGGCATGKKCLVIGDIALKGIVRAVTGMIAVVENGQRKTYFLHQNDPVFNGQVVKIEPDAIVFRETVVDRAGRQSTREVVKRILKPSIS